MCGSVVNKLTAKGNELYGFHSFEYVFCSYWTILMLRKLIWNISFIFNDFSSLHTRTLEGTSIRLHVSFKFEI